MAEIASRTIRFIPATYIAQTHKLIAHANAADDVIFYRSGNDGFSGPSRDLFATGSFTLHELPWSASSDDCDWQLLIDEFNNLDPDGGALAGYISYEAGFGFEQHWQQALKAPDSGFAWRFAQLPCWYVADHATCTGAIMAIDGAPAACIENLVEIVERFEGSTATSTLQPTPNFKMELVADLGELSEELYKDKIHEILEDIAAGRYYELNFTQRFHLKTLNRPSTTFINLFDRLLPKRAFYGNFAGEVVCSLSPELYLKKSGSKLLTRPIKGSMLMGVSPEEWEKLHAEHIMVVDLARNDIGRISDKSPVMVEELIGVREFGGLKHLESVISGHTSFDWHKVVSLTYPAASITGAPKIEVVQAIQAIEHSPRNAYTGACGWVWPNGDLDFNVAIRTATGTELEGEWHYELGAGGAIVSDSNPESEYEECLRKVFPLVSELLL